MALQHLRSSTAHKRPIPTVMSAGQIAINTNEASPALFFKDSNGDLVKVGPVHVGTSAPNSSPASVAATALVTGTVYQILTVGDSDFTLVGAASNTVGTIFTATGTTTGTGTVSGQQGVEKGEMWLDTTGGTYVLKIYDGTDWRSESGTFVDVSGDTMTGDLVMNNADIVFEGSTADDFETTLTVTDPTADRTITLPNITGTVVTTGDTGTVTSTMILDGTIVNADVNVSAAIAGTKIDPDFGSQTIETTGVFSAAGGAAATPSITFTGDLNTGIYSPGADQLAVATNGAQALYINADGDILVADGNRMEIDEVRARDGAGLKLFDDAGAGIFVEDGGNVGIGTSSPNVQLHCTGDIKFGDAITLSRSISTGLVTFTDATVEPFSQGFAFRNNETAEAYRFQNGDGTSTYLTIHGSGNVGIGGSAPNYSDHRTLSVFGAANTGAGFIQFTDTSGNADGAIFVDDGNLFINADYDNTSSSSTIRFRIDGSSEVMRLDSAGNIKITFPDGSNGLKNRIAFTTESPFQDETAYIAANRTATSFAPTDLVFATGTSAGVSERMRINSAGNVGIGNSNPAAGASGGSNRILNIASGIASGVSHITFGDSSAVGKIESVNGNGTIAINATTAVTIGTTGSSTERVRVDSSGRLLVGSSSTPTGPNTQYSRLGVFGNSSSATTGLLSVSYGAAATGLSSSFNIGRIFFGDTGAAEFGYISCEVDGTSAVNDYPGRLVFATTADGSSSPTERMRISSSGVTTCTFIASVNYVIVGTEQGGTTVNAAIDRATNGNGTNAVYIGTSQIQVTSDIRLKHNITNTELNATEKIKQIEIFDFDWNDPRDNEWKNCRGRWTGFSAQQVQPILPFCINAPRNEETREILEDDPSDWVVDPTGFIPVLVKALQEANAKIETLEQRLSDAGIA